MRHPAPDPPADSPDDAPSPRSPKEIAAHRPYYDLVRRLASRKGIPEQDIEDVVQDVFMAAFQALPSLGRVRSMEALLAGICLRRIADYRRAQQTRGPVVAHDEEAASGVPSSQQPIPAPDKANVLKQRAAALDTILGRMEPELRDAFVLIEIQEMTARDAADSLGIKVTALRWRVDRARQQFAELLGPFRAELEQGGYL